MSGHRLAAHAGAVDDAKRAANATALRVLLVEDDDIDAKLIRLHAQAIPDLDLSIERVVSTIEARKVLTGNSFDLCILDFWLGCETSLRFLADLDGAQAGIPAVVLTSLSTPDIRQICQQAGARSFIGKEELSASSLRSAISDVLRATQAGSPLAAIDGLETRLERLLDLVRRAHEQAQSDPAESGDRSPEAAELGALDDMTETMRLGLFERVLSAARTEDAGRLVASAVAIARGVLGSRSQTIACDLPARSVGVACDPATFLFLIFELVCRASQQSGSDAPIRLTLRSEHGAVLVCLSSAGPGDATATASALGPLVAGLLRDRGASVANTVAPDRTTQLMARFRTETVSSSEIRIH